MISVVEPQNQQMDKSSRLGGGSGGSGGGGGASAAEGGDHHHHHHHKPSSARTASSSRKTEKSGSGDELVPPDTSTRQGAHTSSDTGGEGMMDVDRPSHRSDAPPRHHGESSSESDGEMVVSYMYAGTAARLTSAPAAPPPPPAAMAPAKSILRRHSSYGNTGQTDTSSENSSASMTSDSEEQTKTDRKKIPSAAAHADASASAPSTSTSASTSAAAAAPATSAPRRRSMLGVSYNGETAPLSGNQDDGHGAAARTAATRPAARTTAARRHSMLGVSYNGETAPLSGSAAAATRRRTPRRHTLSVGCMPAGTDNRDSQQVQAQGPPPVGATRRHSMLGVSYGAMTAPLSGDGGRSQDGAMAQHGPNKAHRRLSMPKTRVEGVNHAMSTSCRGAERRLSMPRAEIGAASRESIVSRSSSMAHSSTSSVIAQTRRPSLTEIQDFLDSDDDESSGDDDDDEVDLGGDGERRVAVPSSRKAERRLSMPRAEIGPSSRETIRSHSLTTMQIETRRLSLTEVQSYLDGDSSDEDEEEDEIHGDGGDTNNGGGSSSKGAADPQPVSSPSPSRRHSMASVSSQASRPRGILRRHSSYGNSAPPEAPQYVRPDLIRLASLQQQATPSSSDGNHVRRDRSTSIGSAGSSVSFSSISVRSHKQTLGDHPCCHLGPPIALDWQYEDHRPVLVDDWERHRVRDSDNGSSANSERMYIPPYQRRNVLEHRYGHSREETTEAARVARMARRRRSMTRTMLPMAGIEEAGETVAGFAKKVVKNGRQVTKRKAKARRRDSAHF